MTVDEITARVADIQASADDYEVAHSLEDKLYLDFLTHVASELQGTTLGDKASLVLQVAEVEFTRYTA